MVLCAARPELYERHPEWGGGQRNSTTSPCRRCPTSETAVLVSALLERAVLPAETQRVLIERSGGNPLFAEEFVQLLVDRGLSTSTATAVRSRSCTTSPSPSHCSC